VRRVAEGAAGLGIAGLHCFAFGGFARGAHWLQAAAAERFALDDSHRDFAIDD
jgi:hypothetical protein